MWSGVTLSMSGVELLPCAVVIECYAGPPCTARVSDRVRVLALKQPVYLPLPGRAERVTKGHMVAGLLTVGVCLVILRILL